MCCSASLRSVSSINRLEIEWTVNLRKSVGVNGVAGADGSDDGEC